MKEPGYLKKCIGNEIRHKIEASFILKPVNEKKLQVKNIKMERSGDQQILTLEYK